TAEVDDVFLKEIESWRDMLARNLALRNTDLSQRDLNFAVQRTIDRIIFLRICEDRGIEQYGRLMSLQNGDCVYARLCEVFHRADERYNSGLFHFQKEKDRSELPDTLTLSLIIDDTVLKDIIKNLYYPDSPYEFSVLSADILGQVYEQFLGKVIRLTEGHRAAVEEKPEVRKAGGVYYTPTYIVDYIVKNTVGKLLKPETQNQKLETRTPKPKIKDITPKDVPKIRILDPACGSGSFLLGAYQCLLDWHRDWYIANDPEKWATGKTPVLYQATSLNPTPAVDSKHENSHRKVAEGTKDGNFSLRVLRLCGEWRLTTAERRRILLNNIYGVDIDPQAVEVTKLSLLLKVLEGESEQTIVKQLKMFHERALPDLGNNIKCGNSLIGTDFYNINVETGLKPTPTAADVETGLKPVSTVDDEERRKVNPFDWEKEFQEIMKNGGFDAVIGNPPYGALFSNAEKHYLFAKYKLIKGQPESYEYFLFCSLRLSSRSGLISFIVPTNFIESERAEGLRETLLESGNIQVLSNFRYNVWKNNASEPVVIVYHKGQKKGVTRVVHPNTADDFSKDANVTYISQTDWSKLPGKRFLIRANVGLIKKIGGNNVQLATLCDISQGIIVYKTREDSARNLYISENPEGPEWKKLLDTKSSIQRYTLFWGKRYLKYGEWLWCPRDPKYFEQPKIFFIRLRNKSLPRKLVGTYDDNKFYNRDNFNNIILKDVRYSLKYILGLFNSLLLNYWYKAHFDNVNINPAQVRLIPIRPINFFEPDDKARHNRMVALVDQMLELHKQLASAKADHDKTIIQRQIDATDRQIDRLVYELYGLTEEEIKIVEEGSP
ncbi:MAG: N-6 DNA methylase, partial [Candidatus Brocadiales bacterium]|nr:N-6 DNA methylase [Candidatus Brocadiales bacterium]